MIKQCTGIYVCPVVIRATIWPPAAGGTLRPAPSVFKQTLTASWFVGELSCYRSRPVCRWII